MPDPTIAPRLPDTTVDTVAEQVPSVTVPVNCGFLPP